MLQKQISTDSLLRLAIAQLNPIIGDIEGNLAKARAAHAKASKMGADLIIFPAFFISGYPLHDLWLREDFVDKCQWAIDELARDTTDGNPAILLFHTPAVAGAIEFDIFSHSFEETRHYFLDGGKRQDRDGDIFNLRGLGLDIGLDWGCCQCIEEKEAVKFVINSEYRPYQRKQHEQERESSRRQIGDANKPLIYVFPFGGQDGLVFEGGSFGLQPNGDLAFQMPHFAESVTVTEWEKTDSGWYCRNGEIHEAYQGEAADYQACMVGLRDYVNKNGFKSVLLGLSGGVDSALCAALAVDALGAERVQTVMLPYHYTSQESLRDAQDCANLLGCDYQIIPIAAPVQAFLEVLTPAFGDASRDVTEENLQSRTRGVILMALSNKFGSLLLTTGNKSESAVGYATLYGDMCGGFNPINDLYKRDVYALCNWRNKNLPQGGLGKTGEVIPQNIIDRPPSAELSPDQKDEDSLPPYPVLDAILYGLIEENKTIAALVHEGYERSIVERVEELLYKGEFKRQQAAPGVKISSRSFADWHMPITHHFRDRN